MEDFDTIKKVLQKNLGVTFKVAEAIEDEILDEEKKLFTRFINHLEKLVTHEHKVFETFKIDLSTLSEPYWQIIEECLNFSFDQEVQELIWWYIHDRKNAAGDITAWEGEDGVEYKFNTPGDLYEYIVFKFDF
jgi:hypothetical protein